MVGNEIYLQRGETFSLDFAVRNAKGDPFMIFQKWTNPYLAITVSAALYEQEGDYRETYWLDLNNRYVERADGSVVLEPIKKFIATEALYLSVFNADEAIRNYGIANGGKMTTDSTSDFYIGNYLFFVDENDDGNRVYKYYNGEDDNGDDIWVDYDFRVIKAFDTKSWMEQSYLYDIKLLAGESVREHLAVITGTTEPDDGWSDAEIKEIIDNITDDDVRAEMLEYYESGMPLMLTYDTKALILEPTRIYVSVNIQGGVK
jgi:hypothetical protein